MKILINALSGIGDALMFSPTLKVLKEKLPEASIDFLVMFESVKQLYSSSPYINNIYFIDFLRESNLHSLKKVLKLRSQNFDYTVNIYPSNRFEYNVLNFLLGKNKRISYNYNHTNFSRFEFLNNVIIKEVKNKHNVLQNLEIAKKIINTEDVDAGDMEIFLNESSENNALKWFNDNGITTKNIIGLHAGSSTLKNHINKRWDKMKFARLAELLIENFDCSILLFGNETELNEQINNLIGDKGLLVQTENFMDSMAILKKCSLFITNDTAFLHCSSALKIPVVAIFGYTNYQELYPWNTNHRIVRISLECSPCFYNSPKPATCIWKGEDEFKCIKKISVEEVFKACKSLIQEIPDNSKP